MKNRGKQHQFEFHFSVQVTAGLTLFTARVHSANHVATVVCCCLVLKQLYFSVTVALPAWHQVSSRGFG